jgi:hypothetical protein
MFLKNIHVTEGVDFCMMYKIVWIEDMCGHDCSGKYQLLNSNCYVDRSKETGIFDDRKITVVLNNLHTDV